ncbi:MAG: RNA polymerase sigma factor [Deltaproteobacteria bacterium]|nr:RNA polymerase sigma factor [Deltaproteobacteria bacterium]
MSGSPGLAGDMPEPLPTFSEVYDRYFEFVWRVARRLGVAPDAIDDVVQETFLVIHRRFAEERTSNLRTWIYGIVTHMVRNHRRSLRRKSPHALGAPGPDPDALEARADGPEVSAQKAEAARTLYRLLEALDEEKREVFVLVELEQLSAPEVADALDVKLNTVYSRLRVAREEFEESVKRIHARERRGT